MLWFPFRFVSRANNVLELVYGLYERLMHQNLLLIEYLGCRWRVMEINMEQQGLTEEEVCDLKFL